jgi:hypothetical protein
VLGAVEARVGGRAVDLGHARQRSVLAVLLVEVNRAVPADALVDRVWADRVPQRARNALSGYVSRLRRALADADRVRFDRRHAGYLLTVDPAAVDLHRFRERLPWPGRAPVRRPWTCTTRPSDCGAAFTTLDTPWLTTAAAIRAVGPRRRDSTPRAGRHPPPECRRPPGPDRPSAGWTGRRPGGGGPPRE